MEIVPTLVALAEALRRRAKNTVGEVLDDPMGLLSRNVSAFSESLPAAPGEPQNEMLARPGMQDWATGVAMNAPTMGLLGHTVYHGSPHKFDKFDASKIGTGEGAQAYGHGLYFADNPATARTYSANRAYVGAAMNGKPAGINYDDPRWLAQKAIDEFGDAAKAKAHLEMVARTAAKHQTPETSAAVKGAIELVSNGAIVKNGALYKADLPDEWLPKMLDWDKPLSQQARGLLGDLPLKIENGMPIAGGGKLKIVEDADFGRKYFLVNGGKEFHINEGDLKNLIGSGVEGRSAYQEMARQMGGEAAASKRLGELGIPGIRYKDQGSRGKEGGTYNYVVFPGMEHLLKILERE